MNYLFICAIGPVQDFIATARRSRDLWYGSWMLSELSKAAAHFIAEAHGLNSLIFPAPKYISDLLPESDLSVANKIVALLDEYSDDFGQNVRNAMNNRLQELRRNAFGEIRSSSYNIQLAIDQVDDLPEFFWINIAFKKDHGYSVIRDQAESLLAARKYTRNFKQIIGENVLKSSLDGARECVIPKDAYPNRNDSEEQRTNKINQLYFRYGARQGERLSGVDLLKRMGARSSVPDFPSTSHIAALPFLERVRREKGADQDREMLEKIKKNFEEAGWDIGEQDGALLFESRLAEWIPSSQDQKLLSENLAEIIEKHAGESRPSPYYTLIIADGDNMGKTIDAQKNPATHRELSHNLSEFSKEVPFIIKNHQGVSIYAGGDDILAYLPLYTVLKCASELEQQFKTKMEKFLIVDEDLEISPTLSIGIVIAHHLTPLSDVLEIARNTERKAKQVPGKNALGITLSKRGGVERSIYGKFGELHERLNQLINLTRQDAISTGVAYEFQELHRILFQTDIPSQGIVDEAVRIVKRKRESGSGQQISKEVEASFHKWLEKDGINPGELAQQMIVAQMFAGAEDLAGIPLQKTQEVSP